VPVGFFRKAYIDKIICLIDIANDLYSFSEPSPEISGSAFVGAYGGSLNS
jgi:hypothetical protein